MNDLISRQEAIDALARTAREKFNLSDEYSHYLAGLMDGELAIKNLPSVEPKHGRWIDETFKPWGLVHHPYKCDQCGEHSEATSDFCPNCGARMEE